MVSNTGVLSGAHELLVPDPSGIKNQMCFGAILFLGGAGLVAFIRFSYGFATPFLRLRVADLVWLRIQLHQNPLCIVPTL